MSRRFKVVVEAENPDRDRVGAAAFNWPADDYAMERGVSRYGVRLSDHIARGQTWRTTAVS